MGGGGPGAGGYFSMPLCLVFRNAAMMASGCVLTSCIVLYCHALSGYFVSLFLSPSRSLSLSLSLFLAFA